MPQYTVTSGQWTKIASAGATVEIQNLSTYPARISVSSGVPAGNADAEVLFGIDSTRTFDGPLPGDLYASALTSNAAIIEVMPIGPGGASGGYSASGKSAVGGTFSAIGQSASFVPLAGRGFNVSVWGTFVAGVQLERSFDSGATWLPITAAGTPLCRWTTPASEQWSEDETPVLYRLDCTTWTSGTVNYRVSQ